MDESLQPAPQHMYNRIAFRVRQEPGSYAAIRSAEPWLRLGCVAEAQRLRCEGYGVTSSVPQGHGSDLSLGFISASVVRHPHDFVPKILYMSWRRSILKKIWCNIIHCPVDSIHSVRHEVLAKHAPCGPVNEGLRSSLREAVNRPGCIESRTRRLDQCLRLNI